MERLPRTIEASSVLKVLGGGDSLAPLRYKGLVSMVRAMADCYYKLPRYLVAAMEDVGLGPEAPMVVMPVVVSGDLRRSAATRTGTR